MSTCSFAKPVTPAAPLPAYQSAANGYCQVMSRLEASTVTAGEPIIVDFIVKNVGQQKLIYEIRGYEDLFKFVIKDNQGHDVPLTSYGKRKMTPPYYGGRGGIVETWGPLAPGVLKPGESLKCRLLLNQLYDMSTPGTYEITPRFDPWMIHFPFLNYIPRNPQATPKVSFVVPCNLVTVRVDGFDTEAPKYQPSQADPPVTGAN